MPAQPGKILPVTFSPLQTCNITFQTPQETLQGTPTVLPTSDPGAAQVSYTVQTSDLPVITGALGTKYSAIINIAGKNNTSATQTIYVGYSKVRGGTTISSGTINFTCAAGLYWTLAYGFYDVYVGDVVSLRIWSTSADVNWDYTSYHVQYTRLMLTKPGEALASFFASTVGTYPTLSSGNPSVAATNNWILPIATSSDNGYYFSVNVSGNIRFDLIRLSPLVGVLRSYYGDRYAYGSYTHASYRPYYSRQYIPTVIQYRCVPLNVPGYLI